MEPENSKSVIYYHRAYRKLPSRGKYSLAGEILLLFLFFGITLYYFFPSITGWTSNLSRYILSFVMPPNTLVITGKPFLGKNFYVISRIGKFPGVNFILINTAVTVLIAFLLLRIKVIPRSIGIWGVYICLLNILSSLFFFYIPDSFPYDIEIFSELYIKTQITIWFFISLVIPLALAPFPTSVFMKSGIVSVMLVYSIVFGCIRYIVFFYILSKYSYVFMSVLFFALGPLVDFIYIIGLYSFFISLIAFKMKGNLEKWQWSY